VAGDERRRWNARFAARWAAEGADALAEPSAFVEDLLERVSPGRTLDLGGGGGRNAVALARAGFEVTVADISPVGLALARERGETAGVPLHTVEVDLDDEPPPAGPWDLILVNHFLHRVAYRRLPELLAEGGVLAICHPTRRNLERHERPSARFLLEEGELRNFATGLTVLAYDESWSREGRHEARLLARLTASRTLEVRRDLRIPERVEAILRGLPEWFGIEEAIRDYVEAARTLATYAAVVGDRVVGVCLVRRHNPHAGEITLLAVERDHHRSGVGRALMQAAERDLEASGARFVQVKTLGSSRESAAYAQTRRFYEALGYRPLEELEDLWPGNPCLILVKALPSPR
jgi:tellurite methyltransferase